MSHMFLVLYSYFIFFAYKNEYTIGIYIFLFLYLQMSHDWRHLGSSACCILQNISDCPSVLSTGVVNLKGFTFVYDTHERTNVVFID